MEFLGKLTAVMAIWVASVLISGLVFFALWAWIVAPVLGIDALPYTHALGLSVVVAFLKTKSDDNRGRDLDVGELFQIFLRGCGLCLMFLFMGFMVSLAI